MKSIQVHTQETKDNALLILREVGYNYSEALTRTGISRSTLKRWRTSEKWEEDHVPGRKPKDADLEVRYTLQSKVSTIQDDEIKKETLYKAVIALQESIVDKMQKLIDTSKTVSFEEYARSLKYLNDITLSRAKMGDAEAGNTVNNTLNFINYVQNRIKDSQHGSKSIGADGDNQEPS